MNKIKKCKSKMIMELRYPALLAALDNRGRILKAIRSEFQNKIGQWKCENVAVHFADNFDKPSKRILVDHLRSFIMYEDPDTEGEFKDDAIRFVKALSKLFPNELLDIDRLGVRYISIYESDKIKSYNDALSLVYSKYFNENLPISIKPKDCRATIVHENGAINVGPVKEDEIWVKQSFLLPDRNTPSFGLGVDVDSYATSLKFGSDSLIAKNINAVFELTKATESEVVNSLAGD